MEIAVLTISDRASVGIYEDKSGPAIQRIMEEAFVGCTIKRMVVPDDPGRITSAFQEFSEADFILTTGGTGIGPRDITPETTQRYCERLLPGIAEILRVESYRQTPQAMLSRAVAGIKGKTVIVNFPGSVRGAEFCARVIVTVMEHARLMLRGEGH